MEDLDETAMTEIMIHPDGRIFAFGLSREVAEILYSLCPEKHPLMQSLAAATGTAEQTNQEQTLHDSEQLG